jgi:hypothetical protein
MASKHRGRSPVGKETGRARSCGGAQRWLRRLRIEPLEDRRLLTTLTVNTLIDENNGIGVGGVSLREAVGAANTGDTINFSVTGTINLLTTAGGQISIGKSMTIQGRGANLLTIRAADDGPNNSNGSRAFLIQDNFFTLNVTISGLTLTNGDPILSDENDGGGAIKNQENLTLSNCVITGNFAANGGAILSTDHTLTINDCTISNNNAGDGGALAISGSGSSTFITRTTISNNVATNSGGGIVSLSNPVTIVDSTISGNSAEENGGGLYQYGNSLSVTGSTISGNAADTDPSSIGGSGGGIFKSTGSLSVLNSTISGNSAGENGGGGIFIDTSQTVAIKHTTITGNVVANTSGSGGGGINSTNTASLDHTIVAGNLRGASTRDDVSGTFNAYYSLIGDKRTENVNDTGGSQIGQNGSLTNPPIDAKLGLLSNNGGLTLTHALLSGSPALDAGDPAAVANSGGVPQFDQRGTPFSRVVGARIDMGAVEMAPSGPALVGDYNLNHSVDAADYVLWRKTNNTSVSQPYDGADGDGNSAVNANDYTVWRSHFGNTSPGAGSAAQALNDEPAGSESAAESPSGADASSMAFAALATMRGVGPAPFATRRADQSAAGDRTASAQLLLLIQNSAGDSVIAAQEMESATSHAVEDAAFEQLAGELESPLLTL